MTEPGGDASRAEHRRQHLERDLRNTERALIVEQENGVRLRALLGQNTAPGAEARLMKSIDVSDRVIRGMSRGASDLRDSIRGETES